MAKSNKRNRNGLLDGESFEAVVETMVVMLYGLWESGEVLECPQCLMCSCSFKRRCCQYGTVVMVDWRRYEQNAETAQCGGKIQCARSWWQWYYDDWQRKGLGGMNEFLVDRSLLGVVLDGVDRDRFVMRKNLVLVLSRMRNTGEIDSRAEEQLVCSVFDPSLWESSILTITIDSNYSRHFSTHSHTLLWKASFLAS